MKLLVKESVECSSLFLNRLSGIAGGMTDDDEPVAVIEATELTRSHSIACESLRVYPRACTTSIVNGLVTVVFDSFVRL